MTNSADPDQLLLQKPTDLDLHYLFRQGMSCSAREGLGYRIKNFLGTRCSNHCYGIELEMIACNFKYGMSATFSLDLKEEKKTSSDKENP